MLPTGTVNDRSSTATCGPNDLVMWSSSTALDIRLRIPRRGYISKPGVRGCAANPRSRQPTQVASYPEGVLSRGLLIQPLRGTGIVGRTGGSSRRDERP